jgi:hypothetical protein
VPSYDFEVDLPSMVKAAQGLSETIELFKDKDVEDLVPSEGDLGSAVVWGSVEEFKDRWEEGINNLAHDVEEMSGRLGRIAMNYAELDQRGHELLMGVAGRVSVVRMLGG